MVLKETCSMNNDMPSKNTKPISDRSGSTRPVQFRFAVWLGRLATLAGIVVLSVAGSYGPTALAQDTSQETQKITEEIDLGADTAATGTEQSAPAPAVSDPTMLPEAARSDIPPPEFEASSWVLLDHKSGWIVAAKEPDLRVEPASLSKLMTAYIVFSKVADGSLSLTTPVLISEKAWKTEGSRMFVEVNSEVSVEDLLKGLIVQSGNDAAVALAEKIAGSEQGFAKLMNQTSAKLGLNSSHYMNSTGLPHPDHYSTARDVANLSRALIKDFPSYYSYYSIPEFTYNEITQGNRNLLLTRDSTVDGVKTGYTKAAGYCLVGSALRDGTRYIAAVMGTPNKNARASAVHSLLNYAFATYDSVTLFAPGAVARQADVFFGEAKTVPLGSPQGLFVTVPKQGRDKLKGIISLDGPPRAPLSRYQKVGTLDVTLNGGAIAQFPLVALEEVPKGTIWRRVVDSVRMWVY